MHDPVVAVDAAATERATSPVQIEIVTRSIWRTVGVVLAVAILLRAATAARSAAGPSCRP